ncbi:hypothetical protein BaRGS_00012068, partial [Batillaria attramentaria]
MAEELQLSPLQNENRNLEHNSNNIEPVPSTSRGHRQCEDPGNEDINVKGYHKYDRRTAMTYILFDLAFIIFDISWLFDLMQIPESYRTEFFYVQ